MAPARVYDTSPEARLALAARLWDWTPHEGQREFLTLRLDDGSEPRVLVAACGRRWGKTEALGCDIATRLLTDPELGQMAVAPTVDQAAGLFDSVEEKLLEVLDDKAALKEFPHLADYEFKRSPYPLVRRKKDNVVLFSARSAGRNGRNLRGKGTTRKLKKFRVICDERAFIPDVAIEQALRPMLATIPGGGQLVEISSPFGKRGGFYEDYCKGERLEKRYRAVRLPSSQNPLVDREYLDEMRADMTDNAFRSEFLAEFVDAVGAVFLEEDIKAAVCEDDYGPVPLWGCKYVAGVDFGRRGDYTVAFVLEISAPGVRVVYMLRIQGAGWHGQIEKICELLAHWKCQRVSVDRTGIGDALTETLIQALATRRMGCEVDDFVFTGSSKPILIDALSIALAQRKIRYPAHPVLMSELRNFEVVGTTASGRDKMEAAKGHDDCVCALALAVRAAVPLLARVGGVVVGGGGSRTAGTGEKEKAGRWDFSWSQTLSQPVARSWASTIKSRLLALVYRSARVRAAGGYLAKTLT